MHRESEEGDVFIRSTKLTFNEAIDLFKQGRDIEVDFDGFQRHYKMSKDFNVNDFKKDHGMYGKRMTAFYLLERPKKRKARSGKPNV